MVCALVCARPNLILKGTYSTFTGIKAIHDLLSEIYISEGTMFGSLELPNERISFSAYSYIGSRHI